MTTILALDIATCTGFAIGDPENGVTDHGSHRLPKTGDDIGAFLSAYRDWLTAKICECKPWTVIFEAPVLPGTGKTSIGTLRRLYSLAGLTELVAHDNKLDCQEANVSDITTHFVGANAPRFGDKRKQATIAKCRERGWRVIDDNDADALALLDYALSLVKPARALDSTPLFSGALKC